MLANSKERLQTGSRARDARHSSSGCGARSKIGFSIALRWLRTTPWVRPLGFLSIGKFDLVRMPYALMGSRRVRSGTLFAQCSPFARPCLYWRFPIYSSLVRGTSKRRSSGWVRPNISDNDRSVGGSARLEKVAAKFPPDSARLRYEPAYTRRDTPSPMQGAAGGTRRVAPHATRAEAARARGRNQRLAQRGRPASRAGGRVHSKFAACRRCVRTLGRAKSLASELAQR
jgi:hypothetical protein